MRAAIIGTSGVGKSRLRRNAEAHGWETFDCDGFIKTLLHEEPGFPEAEEDTEALAQWMGKPYEDQYPERSERYLELEDFAVIEGLSLLTHSDAGHKMLDTTGSVIYLPDYTKWLMKTAFQGDVLYVTREFSQEEKAKRCQNILGKPIIWDGMFNPLPGEAYEDAAVRCFDLLTAKRDAAYRELADLVLPRGLAEVHLGLPVDPADGLSHVPQNQ